MRLFDAKTQVRYTISEIDTPSLKIITTLESRSTAGEVTCPTRLRQAVYQGAIRQIYHLEAN